MDWIMSHQNSYFEALIHNVTIFGDRSFREVIRLNEVVSVDPKFQPD
jgi:hypothetical protein